MSLWYFVFLCLNSLWNGSKSGDHPPKQRTVRNWLTIKTFCPAYFKRTPPLHTPATPYTLLHALTIHEKEARLIIKQQNIKQAAGTEGVSSSWVKVCADQLVLVFTQMFNSSLQFCEDPSHFKQSTSQSPINLQQCDSTATGMSLWQLW